MMIPHVFYLCRPFLLGEDQDDNAHLWGGGGNGSVDAGGINLPMFVKDGETSFLAQHPTWTFSCMYVWYVRCRHVGAFTSPSNVVNYGDKFRDVTLPNLQRFQFHGVRTYLDSAIHRIAIPRIKKLDIDFFNILRFSVPRPLQLMNAMENLRFNCAQFGFRTGRVYVMLYTNGEAKLYVLAINVLCWHLDWQVSSKAQISDSLGQMFFALEHLTLYTRYKVDHLKSTMRLTAPSGTNFFGRLGT
jgi:hypothetical protein